MSGGWSGATALAYEPSCWRARPIRSAALWRDAMGRRARLQVADGGLAVLGASTHRHLLEELARVTALSDGIARQPTEQRVQ